MNEVGSAKYYLQRIYFKLAHKEIILLAGLSAAVMLLLIQYSANKYLPENTPAIISIQFRATPETFMAVLRQWGKAGVNGYREHLWMDYLFPAAYAIFFASLISCLDMKKSISTGQIPIFFCFPLAAGLLDWLENTIHLQLLGNPAGINELMVFSSFVISLTKWFLLFITILYIFSRLPRLFMRLNE
jgi:hypothetical protein